MKVLYIAKHGSGGNDDEGAIAHALRVLGHEVQLLQEENADAVGHIRADFCLMHNLQTLGALHKLNCPKAFWYFDLVEWPDPTLQRRCAARVAWMNRIIPLVDVGFCTDGDWAKKRGLVCLRQGADERIVGMVDRSRSREILFTGISKGGGVERERFVELMQNKFGPEFMHVRSGCYREKLRELIAKTAVYICPPSPVTNHYWSNRVYNALGFGANVLHPWCSELSGLADVISFYHSQQDMLEMCKKMQDMDLYREEAVQAVKARHLYRHRVAELLRIACGA